MAQNDHRQDHRVSPSRNASRCTLAIIPCRWTAKAGPHPAGDPDLHHYVGELLYKGTRALARLVSISRTTLTLPLRRAPEGSFEIAETHLLAAGKRDSARLLAEMFVEWAGPTGPVDAFALRGTIP